MKKSALLGWMVLLFSVPSVLFAQTKTITGNVTNGNGEPVPLATVQQKGTKNAVTSNDQGGFSITVTGKNPVLVITSVNYQQQQITVSNESNFNIVLTQSADQLSEVVVTALGITRQKKSLGYSAQSVDSKELTENHQSRGK